MSEPVYLVKDTGTLEERDGMPVRIIELHLDTCDSIENPDVLKIPLKNFKFIIQVYEEDLIPFEYTIFYHKEELKNSIEEKELDKSRFTKEDVNNVTSDCLKDFKDVNNILD